MSEQDDTRTYDTFGTALFRWEDIAAQNERLRLHNERMETEAPRARSAFLGQIVGARIVSATIDCTFVSSNPDNQLVEHIVLDNGCVLEIVGDSGHGWCGAVRIHRATTGDAPLEPRA